MTRVINRSFVRAKGWVRVAPSVRLRHAYPATPYEVVELASFKDTLEMAVKTKRSSVRTALLASASLAALAQGAAAAINFAADGSPAAGGTAFPNGATLALATTPCSELIFLRSTGAFVDYKTFADAADKTLYEKGRATLKNGVTGTLTSFADCVTAPGYYIHTPAQTQAPGAPTPIIDGSGLRIEQAPAGWYAAGADILDDSTNAKPKLASELTVAADGAATSITACAAGKYNPYVRSSSCTSCLANTFSAKGATVCTPCPEGTASTGGNAFCEDLAAGYYGDVTTTATAHTTATKCPAGTTSAAQSVAGTGYKCAHIMEMYFGTVGDASSGASAKHATVAACPIGTISRDRTSAGTYYCDGIYFGYYGIAGDNSDTTAGVLPGDNRGYHAVVTACPEGSTSTSTVATMMAGTVTTINNCVTKPGYYLSTAGVSNIAAGTITKVPAGYYAPGGLSVVLTNVGDISVLSSGDYDGLAYVGKCPANANSEAGAASAAFCVCDAGYAPAYRMFGSELVVRECTPILGYAASPTAASPTADSAGASTPIAVALAAAAAVPLLL